VNKTAAVAQLTKCNLLHAYSRTRKFDWGGGPKWKLFVTFFDDVFRWHNGHHVTKMTS